MESTTQSRLELTIFSRIEKAIVFSFSCSKMMYANASVEITMEEKHNDLTEMQEFHGPNYEELKNLALLTFRMHSPAVKPNILF